LDARRRYGCDVSDRRLVTLAHAGTVAAVGRDRRGRAWLGDPRPGTLLEGFRPGVQGLPGDLTLAGGILPPGAEAAVVLDRAGSAHEATCANGAWLAVLPDPVRGEEPLVRFLDPVGDLIAVPLPAGVRLEPVSDATEACPVCGASEWARVVAAPRGRYGEDGAGRPTAAVCGRCGHEEALGVLFAPLTGAPPDRAARGEIEARIARVMTAAARSAPFELYGLAGREPTVAGHGSHDGELDSVRLAFDTPAGRVTVGTSVEHPWRSTAALARQALEGLLHERNEAWPERSETATLLWLKHRHRLHAADAATAPAREVTIAVDGAPISLVTVAHGERFAAVGRVDRCTITIAGHGAPADLSLSKLHPTDL
jgi:hypothetical protein